MTVGGSLKETLEAAKTEGPVALTVDEPGRRFCLRIALENADAITEQLGYSLPKNIGDRSGSGNQTAHCLGPDEWVLQSSDEKAQALVEGLASVAASTPLSLVDISDRDVTFSLLGNEAATLLSVACPINLRDFPVNSGKRTVFDCAQVVLYRDDETWFRMDVARSYAPHVWGMLNIANAELAARL